jgi:ankyrin repeat protein
MSTPGFNSLNEKHEDGSTPIQEACSENNVDIVKELLKQENIIVPEEMYFYSSTIKNLLKIHQ